MQRTFSPPNQHKHNFEMDADVRSTFVILADVVIVTHDWFAVTANKLKNVPTSANHISFLFVCTTYRSSHAVSELRNNITITCRMQVLTMGLVAYVTPLIFWRYKLAALILFLTKDAWGLFQITRRQIASDVIPLSRSFFSTKHVSTLFWLARFSASPSNVPLRERSTVNPVEFTVGLTNETEPRAIGCKCFLFL